MWQKWLTTLAQKKCMVAIAEPSFFPVRTKLKSIFQEKNLSSKSLVTKVNWLRRGWCNSKRMWYCWPHFKKLDCYLWNLITRSIKRRHPTKGTYCRNAKYFNMFRVFFLGHRDKWTFVDPIAKKPMLRFYWFLKKTRKKYKPQGFGFLYNLHNKTPDDHSTSGKQHFRKRAKMLAERKLVDLTSTGNRILAKRQNHLCTICGDSLYNGEPLHKHHKIPLSIHQPCHDKLHYSNNKLMRETDSNCLKMEEEDLDL